MTSPNPKSLVVNGKEYLPYSMGYLTNEMAERVKKEFNETEELKKNSMDELILLLEGEPNLVFRRDENFLLPFLRIRNYNVRKAYKTVRRYYKFQRRHTHLLDITNIEPFIKLAEKRVFGFLPYRDDQGGVVCVCKAGKWNPDEDPVDRLITAGCAVAVHAIKDPASQVGGFSLILDLHGVSKKHLNFVTPHYINLVRKAALKSYPGKYNAVHVVNETPLFESGWKVINPFITKELRKKIHIHGLDLPALHKFLSPDILPEEYGGKLESFEKIMVVDDFVKDEEYILSQRQYGFKS